MTLDDIFKGMSTIRHVFEFVFSEVCCCKVKKFFKCFWCFTTPTTVSVRVGNSRLSSKRGDHDFVSLVVGPSHHR
jgi:predicted small integral membrane protein